MIDWREAIQLLQELGQDGPPGDDVFLVRPLPGSPAGWIGRGGKSTAAFLLRVDLDGPTPAPVELPSLRIGHGLRVRLNNGGAVSEETVSVVQLLVNTEPAIELFVRCIGAVLPVTAGTASMSLLSNAVECLLELFRDASHATESEILGLWSELLVISLSRSPELLVSCWRHAPASRFDFGNDFERVEVKATTGPMRTHEVSFEQANPPGGVAAVFASLMTERVATGTTIRELWHRVLLLTPSQSPRIDQVCVRTLGRDWQLVQQTAFDMGRALATLRLFLATGVPRIALLPAGVSRARFTSDFGSAAPWDGPASIGGGLIDATVAAVRNASSHLSGDRP